MSSRVSLDISVEADRLFGGEGGEEYGNPMYIFYKYVEFSHLKTYLEGGKVCGSTSRTSDNIGDLGRGIPLEANGF